MCVSIFVMPGMVGDELFHRNRIAAVGIHAPINFLAAARQGQYLYFCASKASKLEAWSGSMLPKISKHACPHKYKK